MTVDKSVCEQQQAANIYGDDLLFLCMISVRLLPFTLINKYRTHIAQRAVSFQVTVISKSCEENMQCRPLYH